MQKDIEANYPELEIQLLGVNEAGSFFEAGNESVSSGRDIPWLQDVDGNGDGLSDLWTSWDVTFRDVVILDTNNARVDAFNVTVHDLRVPENYGALRQMLVTAAIPEPTSFALLVIGAAGLFVNSWKRRRI